MSHASDTEVKVSVGGARTVANSDKTLIGLDQGVCGTCKSFGRDGYVVIQHAHTRETETMCLNCLAKRMQQGERS